MMNSYDQPECTEAALKRAFVSQAIVGLSALTSTAILLAKMLPSLMHGFP